MLSATWPTISVGICELLLTGAVLSIRIIPAQRSWPSPSTMMMPAGAPRVGASARMTGSCRKRTVRWGCDSRLIDCRHRCREEPCLSKEAGRRWPSLFRHFSKSHSWSCLPPLRDLRVTIGTRQILLQGYTPEDQAGKWITLGLAADPGVLEINLPACSSWHEYAEWIETVTASCEAAGLRSWKESAWDFPQGTGGGNHLLWGGPRLEVNPFFGRPAWLAAILRFWQHHPSLAYLFTGCYVGASSQAPRPDESARDLYDVEMAYTFLESLPEGDHRELINETLRHLQTDVTGNSHRSEMSFDKFWNTSWPSGALGLVEFRAIESLPRAEWMSSVALLWTCLAAHLLEAKTPRGLKRFGTRLHDEYLLPERLWSDLESVFTELEAAGVVLNRRIYREIWNWRFPTLLLWRKGDARLTVRRALESWPLLCETPVEGGTTSRFVDTSMQRLEFCSNPAISLGLPTICKRSRSRAAESW